MPTWWALPALFLAMLAGERRTFYVVIARQGISYGIAEVFIAVGLIVAPGAWVAVAVTGAVVASGIRVRPWLKTSYNGAVHGLSAMGGVALAEAVNGGVAGACIGAFTYSSLTYVLTAVAVSSTSGEPYWRVLRTSWLVTATQTLGNASVGALGGWLIADGEPLGLFGLIAPLLALGYLYKHTTQRTAEVRLFEELATGQEVNRRSVDLSAQVIVTATARAFGGAEVELVVRHPDGPLRYTGNEHGIQSRARADTFALPWTLRVLASGGVHYGMEDGKPFLAALFGDPTSPLACIYVQRAVGAGAFTRSDQQLAERLVERAESWLSTADLTARHDEALTRAEVVGAANRVIGEFGVSTAPTVAVLRESVGRLSRLADAFDGPELVGDIVDELHTVERAVASLLGAIGMAAGPYLPDGEYSADLLGTDWTSTGTLED